MKAMLFAAGLGTRLRPFTNNAPKALVEVNNRTLLEHNIRYLQKHGITDVVINVHHFASQIEQVLAANNGFGSTISISDESDEVLETGGGLKKALPLLGDEETFVVMNVDVLTSLDLGGMIEEHRASGVAATLAVMDRASSRHFLFNEQMTLCGWINNNTHERRTAREDASLAPFAFSGIQVMHRDVIASTPQEGKFSLVDVYLQYAEQHIIRGFDHTGDQFIDVGKPESIAKAEALFL